MKKINVNSLFSALESAQSTANATGNEQIVKLSDHVDRSAEHWTRDFGSDPVPVNVDKIVEEANWLIDNGYDSHDLWETFCATGRVGSLVADYKRYAMVPVSWDGEPCDEFAWIICDTEEEASEIAHEQLSLDYPTAYIVEYDSLNGEPIGDGPKTVINATYSVWDKASRKNYTFMPAYHPDFRAMADLADEIAKRHGQEVLPDEYDLWDVIDALKSAGCDVSVN